MTLAEVQALSDEEVRVRVAERMGYSFRDEGHRYPDEEDWQKYKAVYLGKDSFVGLAKPDRIPVPRYTSDLNACHEFEKTFPSIIEVATYQDWLNKITDVNREPVWFATARQRCEAFLMVGGAQC